MTPEPSTLSQITFHLSFIVAIPLTIAFIHLLLYLFDRRSRQDLYVSIVSGSFGMLAMTDLGIIGSRAQWVLITAMLLGIAALVYSVFLDRQPGQFYLFASLGGAVAILGLTVPRLAVVPGRILILVIIIETFRVGIVHWKRRPAGSLLPAIGMGVFGLTGVMEVLGDLGAISSALQHSNPYLYGGSFMVLTMSVHLAHGYAVANADLERQLKRVRELIDQMLASERAAREEEIRRRLIEADNERKTRELEEARSLQLSMIPKSIPDAPGYEIAASMEIASEVGGDYYDFHREATGLPVAVGDAVGHGMRAGIIVASTKSLFATIRDDESVAEALLRFDDVLRSMRLRRAHMCLILARFDGSSVEIANAGMPPPLHRAANGIVSEIDVLGPPLGVKHPGNRSSRTVSLAHGETIVLMSDGLPEARSGLDDPILGYDALRELVRVNGGLAPAELISNLENHLSGHLGSSPSLDDVTVVAVRHVPV